MLRFIFFFFFFLRMPNTVGGARFSHAAGDGREGARRPSAQGRGEPRAHASPSKMTASTPRRRGGALSPITYLLFKLQRGQLKQLDRCHVQTDACTLREGDEAGVSVPAATRRRPLLREPPRPPQLNKGASETQPSSRRKASSWHPTASTAFHLKPSCHMPRAISLVLAFPFFPSSFLHMSSLRHETVCTCICPSSWAAIPRHAPDSHI